MLGKEARLQGTGPGSEVGGQREQRGNAEM